MAEPFRKIVFSASLVLLLAALTTVFMVAARHASPGNSDGATVVLEGASIRSGHFLLGGWRLSLDSFWTLDAFANAIATAVVGFHHELLLAVPAIVAAITVALTMSLARLGFGGAPAFVALLGTLAILALPSNALSNFFLQGGQHIVTTLCCLAAFALAYQGRFGWKLAASAILLCAGLLGDLLTVPLGIIPLFLGGLFAMLRCWNWRAGIGAIVTAVSGVVLAVIVHAITTKIGAFAVLPGKELTPSGQLTSNLPRLARLGLVLLGVESGSFGPSGVPVGLALLHLFAVIVIIAGGLFFLIRLVLGIWRSEPEANLAGVWRLEDLVVIAFIADLVLFLYLASTGSDAEARYLVPAVIFGVLLGARLLAYFSERLRIRLLREVLGGCALAILASFVAGFALGFTAPASPDTTQLLDSYLRTHGLRVGIGGYWSASIATVDSDDNVIVRPVIDSTSNRIVRYGRNSAASWYKGQPFQFLVFQAVAIDGVTRATAVATFGRPRHHYSVGPYTVLTWSHPITVSANRSSR